MLEHELHRRVLTVAGVTEHRRHSRERGDVGVAGAVEEHPAPHRVQPTLGGHDQGGQHAVDDDHPGDRHVQQEVDALGVGDEVVGVALGGPRYVDEDRRLLEGDRADPRTPAGESIGHLTGEPADHVVEPGSGVEVETADRADRRGREVAAEEAELLAQHDRGAGARGRDGRAESGGTPAGDDDVRLGEHRELTGFEAHPGQRR